MQGQERAITTLSVWRPKPHNTNRYNGRRDRANSVRQKGREQFVPMKKIINYLALKTRQSHIIEYRVGKIVPQRYWEGNKSPVLLQGSASRKRVSIPMNDQREHRV